MKNKLMPVRYFIDDEAKEFYVVARDREGKSWVVESCGHVLSKEVLDFVYEPWTEKTEDFIQDTRFSTPEQAYEYYLKYRKKYH